MNILTRITFAMLLAGCALPAAAADGEPPRSVEVKGIRDPELQPYRIMAAGFKAMEKHRALAPTVRELRFRLNARRNAPPGVMDGLTLRIEGETTALALPIDAQHVFTLPRSDTASDDNARLNFNRKQSFIRWTPHIRSDGVPADHVRLGDARMECQVLTGIVKKAAGLAVTMMLNGVLRATDWCGAPQFTIPTYTAKVLSSATLLHGGERIALKIAEDGMGFHAPLADLRYGHDDLIELAYAQ